MTSPHVKIWTRAFTLHWAGYFLMAVSFYFLVPTLPIFAVQRLGARDSEVGYLIGVYTLASVTIRPFAGYVLDAVGRKAVYLTALAAFALLNATYALVGGLGAFLVLRGLHGFSWGTTTSAGGTIAADMVPESRRSEGLGYFGLTMPLAMALGPSTGLLLIDDGTFGVLFFAAGAMGLLALSIALFEHPPRVPRRKGTMAWRELYEKDVLHVCVVMLLSTSVYGAVLAFIALHCERTGIGGTGVVFLTYALSVSVVRLVAGKLIDRAGPAPSMLGGYLFLMVGFWLLASPTGMGMLVVAAILIGAGNANVWLTLQTMVIDLVPAERRGVATGTFYSAIDVGIGAGAVAFGWLSDAFGTTGMYRTCAVFLLLPAIYFFGVAYRDYRTRIRAMSAGNPRQDVMGQ